MLEHANSGWREKLLRVTEVKGREGMKGNRKALKEKWRER
jgi:hypothetical protein